MIGSRIDKYVITKKLGEGGMGAVYVGEHEVLRKKAAIKVLLPHWTQNAQIVQRFVNEAIAMGALEHPNIVAVTDAGQLHDGSWFIVMEFLDGGTLGAFCMSHGPLSAHLALQILAPVAAGLEAAHARGIVHRDLKPDNIFLTQRGRNNHFVKILDWGISKLGELDGGSSTRTGMVAGTPAYMAPEQMENLRAADQRSDVFALGVIAYQMVTGGWLPFQSPERPQEFHNLSAVGIAKLIDTQNPVDPRRHAPTLPEGWANAILAAIHKDPRRRPQSARAFILALAQTTPSDAYQGSGTDIVKAYAEELLEIGNLEETVRAAKPSTTKTPSRYRIVEQLGAGGMAEVFRATQVGAEGFARSVAVKRVLPGFSNVPQFVSMFVTEAKLASLLEHPNIVSVVDFDRDEEGRLFLAMEFVEGKDLAALAVAGRLPFSVTIFIISEVLAGLGYAHELPAGTGPRGIVHRDVSPQNVLISWEGAVKVSDFGIAKAREATAATASTMIKGKPQYMSPEQANGQALDGRSDLFAVGIMLWELLTGRRLFDGATREVLLQVTLGNIARPSAIAPDVPPDLEAVTMRLLAVDPSARFANAGETIDALSRCHDAPRNGRAELVRLLAAAFPIASRASRSSMPQLQASTVANRPGQATREDAAPQPTPAPAWPPSTTLGGAASQVSPPSNRRGPLVLALGLAVAVIAGGAAYIVSRQRATTPAVAASEPAAGEVTVPMADARVAATTVTLRTEPATAIVRVDGIDRGRSPVVVNGANGQRVQVEARADGFRTSSFEITLGVEGERLLQLQPLPLVVDAAVSPPDAQSTSASDASNATSSKVRVKKPPASKKTGSASNNGDGTLDMGDVLD
ncbi:MAG: protein kinase [Kofleriaceae bacterium]